MSAPKHTADRIEGWLLKMQRRDYDRDRGSGIRSASEVGQAVGLSRKAARAALSDMAEEGRILRFDFANGLKWRSANLLPYEKTPPPYATPSAAKATGEGAS